MPACRYQAVGSGASGCERVVGSLALSSNSSLALICEKCRRHGFTRNWLPSCDTATLKWLAIDSAMPSRANQRKAAARSILSFSKLEGMGTSALGCLPLRVNPDLCVRFRQGRFAPNQIARLLRDHDGGRVCVATDDRRHDGCIDDAQAVDPMDTTVFVNHGIGTNAHSTRSNRVVTSFHSLPDEGIDFGIRLRSCPGRQFLASER